MRQMQILHMGGCYTHVFLVIGCHQMNSVALFLLTCQHVLSWLFVCRRALSFSSFEIFTAGSPPPCTYTLLFNGCRVVWAFQIHLHYGCLIGYSIQKFILYTNQLFIFYIPYKETPRRNVSSCVPGCSPLPPTSSVRLLQE